MSYNRDLNSRLSPLRGPSTYHPNKDDHYIAPKLYSDSSASGAREQGEVTWGEPGRNYVHTADKGKGRGKIIDRERYNNQPLPQHHNEPSNRGTNGSRTFNPRDRRNPFSSGSHGQPAPSARRAHNNVSIEQVALQHSQNEQGTSRQGKHASEGQENRGQAPQQSRPDGRAGGTHTRWDKDSDAQSTQHPHNPAFFDFDGREYQQAADFNDGKRHLRLSPDIEEVGNPAQQQVGRHVSVKRCVGSVNTSLTFCAFAANSNKSFIVFLPTRRVV